MSHHPTQTASASRRFDLSIDDFRKQAGAGGFWRGLGVGFLSAFFLFDYGLAHGAGVQAMVGFAARNGTTVLACAGAAIAALVLGRAAIRGVRSERERRGKLKHVRERLGI